MLKGVAGLGAAAALSSCTPIIEDSGGATKTSTKRAAQIPVSAAAQSQVLPERAADYLQQIFEVARGPGGLIISHSRFDTRRPLQEGEEHPFLHQVLDSVWGPETPKPTVAEWYYGENTL